MLELALDVAQQRGGAEAEQVGRHPLRPERLVQDDEVLDRLLGDPDAARRRRVAGLAAAGVALGVAELLTPALSVGRRFAIAWDEAKLREGLTKVAVYRDEAGVAHEMSALCTHLQCVIRWNGEERSWDCPCHGSRFAPTGEVIVTGGEVVRVRPAVPA